MPDTFPAGRAGRTGRGRRGAAGHPAHPIMLVRRAGREAYGADAAAPDWPGPACPPPSHRQEV